MLLSPALRHRFGGREVPVAGRSGYDGSYLVAYPDRISAPPSSTRTSSGPGSEEEYMSAIVLSMKASKLMRVCEAEGFATIDDLIALTSTDVRRLQAFRRPTLITVCDLDSVILSEDVYEVAQTRTDVSLEFFSSAYKRGHLVNSLTEIHLRFQ